MSPFLFLKCHLLSFIMILERRYDVKNKEYALKLLKQKINGEIYITYKEITNLTGYSKRQLIRLNNLIEKKDINSLLIHGSVGKKSNNSASNREIEYIINFKKKYPTITISQFMDIYHEDVIFNKAMKEDITKYNLKLRSYSFFQQLFSNQGWVSPIKHRKFSNHSESHPLRDASPKRGILVMIDGTPHDWFQNGKKQSLHLAIDDATGELLCGWFMPTECLVGYCHLLYLLITKYGSPENLYSDRYSVFFNEQDQELTQFGRMCKELGINMIFANTPQAKGKVERWNFTIQNRLLVDIKRFNIQTVDELNKWFNSYYIKYLNKKFAYDPKEKDSEFVKVNPKTTNLSLIFCRKEKRKIVNGNCISYYGHYYQIINNDGTNYPMFKGTTITVLEDIFNNTIRIEYRNKIFLTKLIEDKLTPSEKRRQTILQNKKDLEQALLKRDSMIHKR